MVGSQLFIYVATFVGHLVSSNVLSGDRVLIQLEVISHMVYVRLIPACHSSVAGETTSPSLSRCK
jgi:hypothetical protein